jgi:hypothetical protein
MGGRKLRVNAAGKDIGTTTSKHEALRYISEQHYFQVVAEDREPYPSAVYPEPRWHVLIAWARKDCVTRGCMFDHDENDCWQITRGGLYIYSNCARSFQDGTWEVRRCYVWTEALKKRFLPTYEPNSQDRPRPRTLYRDIDRQIFADLFAGFKG